MFSAAFYLKELQESELLSELFVLAFKQAETDEDLWWQVRALQELGWSTELSDLLLRSEAEIEASQHPLLQVLLASARADSDRVVELQIDIARNSKIGVFETGDEEGEDNPSPS